MTITQTITALDGLTMPSRTQDADTFDTNADAFAAALPTLGDQLDTFATQANALETNVNAKEATATTAAANAAASESAAAATVGATMWSSGSYTTGQAAVSPSDLQTYRRKAPGGSSPTDPANDSTNWTKLGSSGIGSVASVTDSTTLTAASAGYQSAAMTALGKAFTLPDATTMTVGGPRFILKNDGGYPFGIRDSAGTLVGAVAAGGIAYVTLKDSGSAAGSWSVIGDNLEPGLITIDNTFSSTYASTVLKPFVALDDNKSIHFLNIAANGFAAVAVDKTTGAVGTPLAITTTASSVPKHCFKIASTTAIVFYAESNDILRAAVISLSGDTTLAVGTAANSGAQTGIGAEDFSGAAKIAQLDTTHYLVSWATATGAGNTSVMAIEVTAGTTVTFGAKADIIAANNVADSTTTYALTATTALVFYVTGAAAPYSLKACVISVAGTVCTVNASATLSTSYGGTSGDGRLPSNCLLSATKAIVIDDNNLETTVRAIAVTVAGTAVTAGTPVAVETGIAPNTYLARWEARSSGMAVNRYISKLSRVTDNSALLWYDDGNGVSRAVILSESAGVITVGGTMYRSISGNSSAQSGFGAILPHTTTDFLALKQWGSAGYYSHTLVPHKISGSTVTVGQAAPLESTQVEHTASIIVAARLSSGDHIIGGVTSSISPLKALTVVRSNGDSINFRGQVTTPPLINSAYPLRDVAGNLLVLLGSTYALGTTVALGTYQLRLISVEICA